MPISLPFFCLSTCLPVSHPHSKCSSSPHLSVCQRSTLTGSIAEVLICLPVFLSLYPSMTHSESLQSSIPYFSICLSPSLTLTASVAVVLICLSVCPSLTFTVGIALVRMCLSVCLRHSPDSRHSVSPHLSVCLSVTHLDSQRSGSPHQIHHHSRPGRRISCFVTDTGCGSGRQTILCNIEALAWSYL